MTFIDRVVTVAAIGITECRVDRNVLASAVCLVFEQCIRYLDVIRYDDILGRCRAF